MWHPHVRMIIRSRWKYRSVWITRKYLFHVHQSRTAIMFSVMWLCATKKMREKNSGGNSSSTRTCTEEAKTDNFLSFYTGILRQFIIMMLSYSEVNLFVKADYGLNKFFLTPSLHSVHQLNLKRAGSRSVQFTLNTVAVFTDAVLCYASNTQCLHGLAYYNWCKMKAHCRMWLQALILRHSHFKCVFLFTLFLCRSLEIDRTHAHRHGSLKSTWHSLLGYYAYLIAQCCLMNIQTILLNNKSTQVFAWSVHSLALDFSFFLPLSPALRLYFCSSTSKVLQFSFTHEPKSHENIRVFFVFWRNQKSRELEMPRFWSLH